MSELIFDRVNKNFKENKEVRLKGGYNCIPWTRMKKLSKIIPGIQRGKYILVSASQKVGKSKICDYLFVYEPYHFIKTHKTDIKLKIIYFSLEVSKEEKIKEAISHKIHEETGKIITPEKLTSSFEDYILDEETEKLIGSFKEYFEDFESTVEYVDNIRNPYGIYRHVKDYAEDNGTYTYKTINWKNDKTGLYEERDVIDYYVPNDPNEYVIIIVDHMSLLQNEKGYTQHQSITKFSSDYCLSMRDRFNYTIVVIQQQAAEVEKQQFTFRGETIIEKLKPSPDNLAENKLVSRDINLMLSLFAPHRYRIEDYEGYDIVKMGDYYRELMINLNRNGLSNKAIDLFFHGGATIFMELPKPTDKVNMTKVYNLVDKLKEKE